jgi:hypothetical protein
VAAKDPALFLFARESASEIAAAYDTVTFCRTPFLCRRQDVRTAANALFEDDSKTHEAA